jgi:nucleoside-diphosphate-sugar epimerase
MQFLVLGGNGFLGSKLCDQLTNKGFELILYERNNEKVINVKNGISLNLDDYIEIEKSFNVINLLAAWGNTNSEAIKNANYELPLKIFNKIQLKNKMMTWVQICSYYQFYYLQNGIDKDDYSYWKRILNNQLSKQSLMNSKINILEVYLPHLYGEKDKQERLITMLTQHDKQNSPIQLSSGRQILPILNINDCSRALIEILSNISFLPPHSELYIKEQTQLTVKEIVDIVGSFNKIKAEFNKLNERKNEFYSEINVPIQNFVIDNPVTLKEYLETLYSKGRND